MRPLLRPPPSVVGLSFVVVAGLSLGLYLGLTRLSGFMGFPLERPETGRVYPEFFHLFPAFGAYLYAAMGVRGALATPAVFGVLGTLAVYFALRRLFGLGPALLGGLLLGGNAVQVWFARYPVSETVSQFLFFLALPFIGWFERPRPLPDSIATAVLPAGAAPAAAKGGAH